MKLKTRSTQTKIKHEILAKYILAWGGIITNGVRGAAARSVSSGREFDLRLTMVDGFGYAGRYDGEQTDALRGESPHQVWGSPVLAAQALDKLRENALTALPGARVSTNLIAVEKTPSTFDELAKSFTLAGLENRLTDTLDALAPGQIALLKGDFRKYVDDILLFTDPPRFSLYFLDPYGPKGIPFREVVRPIVAQEKTDVIINFPYQDVHKKSGYYSDSYRDDVTAQRIISNHSRMFGDSENEWAAAFRLQQQRGGGEAAEEEMAALYWNRLREADPRVVVKRIPLKFPDKARTMFYLYLTTRDSTGALVMNQLLHEARLEELVLREQFQIAQIVSRFREEGQKQASLFGPTELLPEPSAGAPQPRHVDIEALAQSIKNQFRGSTVPLRSVFDYFAESDLFATDIKKALTRLKRSKGATYDRAQRLEDILMF